LFINFLLLLIDYYFMTQPIAPIRASTQSFIEIEDIQHDLVLFADGSVSVVITTSAVNFGLLSEKEQESIIYAYAGLLNSLSFPIQIIIQTKHKDISAYLKLLEDQEAQEKNPKLVKNIHSYRLFVSSMVKENDVLDKKFYIVIPFSNLELGASVSLLFGAKRTGLPYDKAYIFDKAQTVLLPKRDQVIRLLSRVGLRATQLDNDGLIKLFFSLYNPSSNAPDTSMFVDPKEKKT
jgi:hypothetical protein